MRNIFHNDVVQNEKFNDEINNLFKILEDISRIINSEVILDLNVLNEILNTYINNQTSNLDRRKN